MTTPVPTASPRRTPHAALARARTALDGGMRGLRACFNRAALMRGARLVAAPLLMTTALSSDVVTQAPPDDTVWGHGAYGNAFAQNGRLSLPRHISIDSEGQSILPMRCYKPQKDERHPLLNLNAASWRGFYQLSRAGDYSRALHAQARALDLSVCETSETTLVRNYDGDHRLTGISEDATLAVNIREAAHGITHALMQHNGLSAPAADEALFSRLNRHLTAEAIALTAEYVVAAELKMVGEDAVMRSLEEENHPALAVFLQALHDATPRKTGTITAGTITADTIAAAAGQTVSFLVREPAFITANSDIVLRNFLSELVMPGQRPQDDSTFGRDDMHKMASASRRALTQHARLLSGAELATASPATAAIVDALQRMHAEKNRYRAPKPLAAAMTAYRTVTREAVQTHINISGGIYSVHQSFDRAANAAKNVYPEREWQLGETFRHGLQADYTRAQTPASAQMLWDHLDRLRRHSPSIGPDMMAAAQQANIVMCYGHLAPNLRGEWQPASGLIVMAHSLSDNHSGNIRTLGHELLHLMQNAYGISHFSNTWGIHDIQTMRLTQEAAASTIAVLIAMEFKAGGDNSLWSFGSEQPIADRMLDTYTAARAQGSTHQQALESAGLEGFHLMFDRQSWRDIYNNSIATLVLERLHSDWLKAPAAGQHRLEHMRRSGEVSAAFNFTRDLAAAPDDVMLFGSNDDMRHLFDYLHLQQLQKNNGAAHDSVVAQRALMAEKNNPYIDLDFADVVAHYNADTKRPLLETLNCMTGRGDCPAAGLPAPVHSPAPPPRVASCAGR